MKQKDIALIIIIVFVSGVLSFFISNKFISSPKHDLKAAKVEPITADFNEPSNAYFNDKSVNPTQLIRVDNNKNQSPFDGQ
ncbi:MAG TPA: hypothetical protein VK674_05365 [Candidatus Limnocylindria bacterium]|nr:hypothetical protein [Candidatus Limnocylindria bacterium]